MNEIPPSPPAMAAPVAAYEKSAKAPEPKQEEPVRVRQDTVKLSDAAQALANAYRCP